MPIDLNRVPHAENSAVYRQGRPLLLGLLQKPEEFRLTLL